MHNSLLHLLLKNGDFLNTDISQGSVATRLGCGGVFVYELLQTEVVREDCQARKLNKEDAMDRCKWRKMIKEAR